MKTLRDLLSHGSDPVSVTNDGRTLWTVRGGWSLRLMGVEGFIQFVEDLAEQALLEAGVPPETVPNLAGASAQRDLADRAALFAEPRSSRSPSRQRVDGDPRRWIRQTQHCVRKECRLRHSPRQKSASGQDEMSTFSTCTMHISARRINGAGIDSIPIFRASALKTALDLPAPEPWSGLWNMLLASAQLIARTRLP